MFFYSSPFYKYPLENSILMTPRCSLLSSYDLLHLKEILEIYRRKEKASALYSFDHSRPKFHQLINQDVLLTSHLFDPAMAFGTYTGAYKGVVDLGLRCLTLMCTLETELTCSYSLTI